MRVRCKPLLGTFVEIAVPAGFEGAIEAAFETIAHVHARMSFHGETSDLALLRRAKVGQPVTVDSDTVAVLSIARDLHLRSAGLFDVAVGAELVADGFLPRPEEMPVGAGAGTTQDIAIVDDDRVACLAPMLIDLGGIAKGYAVDRAIEVLRDAGVPRAVVNAGGDLRVLGDVPETVHLREADGRVLGAIQVADAALASSGNQSDWKHSRGRLATPHFGRGRAPIAAAEAVTIIASRCVIADAMTKVALADRELAGAMLADVDGAIVPRPVRALAA